MPLEFILTNTNTNQLLYQSYTYYRVAANYWKCTQYPSCKSTVSTDGETVDNSVSRHSKMWHDHHPMDALLSGTQIENFLRRFACKSDFMLSAEKATTLAQDGKCTIGARKLSNCRYVYGAVLKSNHWQCIFVDIEELDFVFIDPYGASETDLRSAFLYWLAFVNTRKDLAEMDRQKAFKQRVIEHPKQSYSYNCGVYVCKLLSMLVEDQPIQADAFDASIIDNLRADILTSK